MIPKTAAPAIIHPRLDPWLVGGLSIVILGLFLVMSDHLPTNMIFGNFLVLTVLINGTHFMASYALLYSSQEYVRRYRAAAIYMPIGLLSVGALSLWLAAPPYENGLLVQGILVITSLYLALHYTGQAWGMMASHAFMHKVRFEPRERSTLRGCLRIMAAWQMVWALLTAPTYIPSFLISVMPSCMNVLHVVAIASLLVGSWTLIQMRRRLGDSLPSSLVLPFASLYVWYLFLWIYPQSIFWVQIFHAIQYLSFPTRVELNRAKEREELTVPGIPWRHLLKYSATLAASSLIVFVGIDKGLNYPLGGFEAHWLVLCSLINIHHYFIDGCIWHISNPEVKADLFAHLRAPVADGQMS